MTNSHPPEYQLILRCRGGDDQAFEELYRQYRLPLFSYLHRLLPGRLSLVEDIFQQVWLKAVRHLDQYEDRQKFLAWLCRIAYNLVMDYFRRNKDSRTEELTEILPSPDADSSSCVQEKELSQAVRDAIRSLPDDQQEIIRLRLQGLSFKEISDLKKIKLNTALGRMRYAVLKLREMLSDYV